MNSSPDPQLEGRPSLYETYREVGVVSSKIDTVIENQSAIFEKIDAYDKRISDLERAQSSIFAIGSVIAIVVSCLANWVRVKFFNA